MALAVRPGTDEWRAVRRASITSTDIPILLGLSPYKSEGQLAREKLGEAEPEEETRRMRLGRALEVVIRAEDETEHGIRLRRVNRILTHSRIAWAKTSLDFERVGEKVIVEAKSSSAGRWDEGLPQDIEAQVQWQMAVGGYPRAHIAALRFGSELACFDLDADPALFDNLVAVATDFRRRLADGGPFAESAASLRQRYPSDDGTEAIADTETAEAVAELLATRTSRKSLEATEEALEVAIKGRMGTAAVLIGHGFRVTWKRTKDSETVDWKSVATGLLTTLPETERVALVGLATTVRPGFRPLRVVADKEAP